MATAAANIIERMVHILVLRYSGSICGCREPCKSNFRANFRQGSDLRDRPYEW